MIMGKLIPGTIVIAIWIIMMGTMCGDDAVSKIINAK